MMATSKKLLRRYTTLPVLIDMLINKRMTIVGYESWADANDRHSMDKFKATDDKMTFLGAYCVAKSAIQSFHQWKVFADGQSGVCIVFNADEFYNFCGSLDSGKYMCRDVKYVPFKVSKVEQDKMICNAFDKVDKNNLPFLKRADYSAEEEFRIVYCSSDVNETVHHINIDTKIISKLILSPFLSDGLVKSVTATLKGIVGCPESVTKARLVDSKAWKRSLNRYAAKALESVHA